MTCKPNHDFSGNLLGPTPFDYLQIRHCFYNSLTTWSFPFSFSRKCSLIQSATCAHESFTARRIGHGVGLQYRRQADPDESNHSSGTPSKDGMSARWYSVVALLGIEQASARATRGGKARGQIFWRKRCPRTFRGVASSKTSTITRWAESRRQL